MSVIAPPQHILGRTLLVAVDVDLGLDDHHEADVEDALRAGELLIEHRGDSGLVRPDDERAQALPRRVGLGDTEEPAGADAASQEP